MCLAFSGIRIALLFQYTEDGYSDETYTVNIRSTIYGDSWIIIQLSETASQIIYIVTKKGDFPV